MKKPKSKAKQMGDLKRAAKRNKRLKESRKKVAKRRQNVIDIRIAERKKYEEFMKKLEEARNRGEF